MDKMRMILAVLAALLALVYLAVWFAKGQKHSTKGRGAVLLYSVLLASSSIVLWMGSQNKQIQISREEIDSPAPTPTTHVNPVPLVQEMNRSKVDSVGSIQTNKEPLTNHVEKSSGSTNRSTAVFPDHKRNSPLQLRKVSPPRLLKPSSSSASAEELIEENILEVFTAVEVFFETYGSEVASQMATSTTPTGTSAIEFEQGSAELSDRSIQYLKSLASELGTTYEDGQLEIRAQISDNVDTPEHRFQLTQSRAEAVRDVLASEGFPADRLVPIGTEQAGETRVKFVHRPN